MTIRRFLTSLALLALLGVWTPPGASAATNITVRLEQGAAIEPVLDLLDGKLLGEIPDARTYLISVPSLPPTWLPLPGVEYLELDNIVSLPAVLQAGILAPSFETPAHWYAAQPSLRVVGSSEAQAYARGRGVVVAVIDSDFDYSHPALRGHLTSGYDFVTGNETGDASQDQSSAGYMFSESDSGFLDQSSASYMFGEDGFLDQSSASYMFESAWGFLDQSSASYMFEEAGVGFVPDSVVRILSPANAAYSHGTLTAGLVAVTAPEAMIMPLRAFNGEGQADVFTLAKAVRYAVRNGAHVISMSWGTFTDSKPLRAAIEFARGKGVVLVASAGNMNNDGKVYPAAYAGVMAVAATDDLDRKAWFSNFGKHIWVDAPGVNIISAYPGGYYGISSGTSFSAPIVAGQAALVRSLESSGVELRIGGTSVGIDDVNPNHAGKLGLGRVDVASSAEAAAGGN